MDMSVNFTCPLCLELAKDAVESSCCTKIYCLRCIQNAAQKFKECPCCRSPNMTYSSSRIARKVISEIKVPCDHCQLDVESGDMDAHLVKCPQVKIKCKLCNLQLVQADVLKHTAGKH